MNSINYVATDDNKSLYELLVALKENDIIITVAEGEEYGDISNFYLITGFTLLGDADAIVHLRDVGDILSVDDPEIDKQPCQLKLWSALLKKGISIDEHDQFEEEKEEDDKISSETDTTWQCNCGNINFSQFCDCPKCGQIVLKEYVSARRKR